MPNFARTSIDRLNTCHPNLQKVFHRVVENIDCTILEGHRTKAEQDRLFLEGKSKLRWPDGKHCSLPSRAVDAAPFPVDFNDRERFFFFAGWVIATGLSMGIVLRWGGDWDGDKDFKDNKWDDLCHFELV